MRLIVHLGFHKTASTWLQHLLNDHHEPLRRHGIWYEHQPGYPAHHFAAWALLMGDSALFEAMLRNAAAHHCHTLILSSEDLEAVIYNPDVADLVEAAAARAGVTEIEWHIALREPGAYFASLHAQLQHHVYTDALTMFTEVLRKGMLFIADPLPGRQGTPYWCYCFDHHEHIAAFAASTRFPVLVHDYEDADPFPGWRLLDRIGALHLISTYPHEEGRNRRLDVGRVADGYRQRVAEAFGADIGGTLGEQVENCIRASLAAVPMLAGATGRRFADSHKRALAEFGIDAENSVAGEVPRHFRVA